MSNLQPKQFQWSGEGVPWFHASKTNLTPGKDAILPVSQTGRKSAYEYENWDDEPDGSKRGDWTFAADTEDEAEAWTPNTMLGRPTTYVVDAQSQPYHDFEDHHYLTGGRGDGEGQHIKVQGPMPIVDRIDIPRPRNTGGVVQGTLPPLDWGMYGRHYTPGANSVEHVPAYTREQTDITERNHEATMGIARKMREDEWRAKGQQELGL